MDEELAANLKEVEDLIYGYNEEAIKKPGYLTVVYLGQLSSRDIANYRSELEQLRGIAVAQKGSLADRPVRVLLANGGDGMDYGAATAEAIARAARADDTLVAVVGLGISRTGTQDAIIRLARPDTRIPTIGTVITATGLATETSLYYHQIGPTNKREAEVGAFYAETQLGARNAVIYYPDDKDDLYSSDLREQATFAFGARGFEVREKSYRIDADNIYLAGRDACDVGPKGVAFYAGRATQLFAFANGMRDKCEGNYPRVLGGDAVSRFVLDGGLKSYPGLIIDYLSPDSSLAWGSDCEAAINSTSFLTGYRDLFGEGVCPINRHNGSLLGHDALLVFTQGVRNAVDRPSPDPAERPSPDAVLRGIEHISGEAGSLRGASGKIDYSLTDERAIPKDKAILVLRGQASADPTRMLLCGQHDTAQPPPDKCPPQPGP
ncbi:MAG TPA: ABC transporter substrate-binding protein [Pseudonocardiaceae bacterium]|nr:ABC transporter substrate-binding protein [Pseudonocardiaceae bacterium]